MPLVPLEGSWDRLLAAPAVATLLLIAVVATTVQLGWPGLRVRYRLGLHDKLGTRESWRLVTWLFPSEWGLLHLVGNGGALFLYGPYLEEALGSLRFGLLYLLAGALGGGWSVAVAPRGLEGNAGSSQSTFAVFGGLLGAGLALSLAGQGAAPLRQTAAVFAFAHVLILPLTFIAGLVARQGGNLAYALWGVVGHSPGTIVGVLLGFAFASWSSGWSTILAATVATSLALLMLSTKRAPWRLFPSDVAAPVTPWLERRGSA